MPMHDFIHVNYEEIVDLDETPLNDKRRRTNVVEHDEGTMISFAYHSENFERSKEVITLGANIKDGIINTTQLSFEID